MHFVGDWRPTFTVSELPTDYPESLAALKRGSYAKLLHQTADLDATAAMRKFEHSLDYAPNMHLGNVRTLRVM